MLSVWHVIYTVNCLHAYVCAFCFRHVPHYFTSGFWYLLEKITPIWNFTLVSQIKTKFTPAWDSLVRNNMWMLIMNLLSTLFVYVNLKMAPNLGKKCCEFFKLPDIFLILSYRKFTGGYSYLSVSCYYTWCFLICQYINHDSNLAI